MSPPPTLTARLRVAVEAARDATRGAHPWPADPADRHTLLRALADAARVHRGAAPGGVATTTGGTVHTAGPLLPDPGCATRRVLAAEALVLRAELLAVAYRDAATTEGPEGRPTLAAWAARAGLSESRLRAIRAECPATRALCTRGSGPRPVVPDP